MDGQTKLRSNRLLALDAKNRRFDCPWSDRHGHPWVEACRWSAAESEIVQIIGRARGCSRTATDPVDVWVLSSVPLSVPVNRLNGASDLTPSPGDLTADAGGVELATPTDANEAYPILCRTGEAAKSAMARAEKRLGANPYKRLFIRECTQPPPDERPAMVRVTYQLAGTAGGYSSWVRSSSRSL
jgi:hypothetical protein